MSQHSSLKAAHKITTRRNVLKRFERVDLLRKPQDALYRNGGNWRFSDVTGAAGVGDRGFGLPKVKPE